MVMKFRLLTREFLSRYADLSQSGVLPSMTLDFEPHAKGGHR